jgi:hypothetical protein
MRVVREEERVKRVLPVAPAIDEEEAFAQFGVLGLDRCHFDILVNQVWKTNVRMQLCKDILFYFILKYYYNNLLKIRIRLYFLYFFKQLIFLTNLLTIY